MMASEFSLIREIKVGDILTAGSIAIAAFSFLNSMLKDRRLKRREYADRIRLAAGATLAGIERWLEIAGRHFENIHPLITDTDVLLVESQDVVKTRDSLWRALMAAEALTSARILDEKLEVAFIPLYSYDPSVVVVYSKTIASLRDAFKRVHVSFLGATQKDVLSYRDTPRPIRSAQLGNDLRLSAALAADLFAKDAVKIVQSLREQLVGMVQASDEDIFKRRLKPLTATLPNET